MQRLPFALFRRGYSGRVNRKLWLTFVGPPASGKGTIANMIMKDFEMSHLASGDLLRQAIHDPKSELGKQAKGKMQNGELVDDEIIEGLIEESLSSFLDRDLLIDGVPRTLEQAKKLDAILEAHGRRLSLSLNLDVPDEELINRVTGRRVHVPSGRTYHIDFKPPREEGIDDVTGEELVQRPDDTVETVSRRIELYRERVAPILEYYDSAGILVTVSGNTSAEIYPKVKEVLELRCGFAA